MSSIRVVAAVVDVRQLTLYKEDGKTVIIPQGDPRLRKILDAVTPIVSEGGVATVDISDVNVYREFEKQTGGITRFFRVARSKVASFFGASEESSDTPVEPQTVGELPALSLAIDDIMANAQSATNNDFSNLRTNETLVAVVGSGAEAKVIPGMENLKDQFTHALKLGSTTGVEAFLRRLSAVIDQRRHSIHDLLRFMERGDLPIADDGSIVIYKVLNRSGDSTYVDCHTGRVQQRVGSYVCMDPALVDHDRRQECSNGLHVARRGYLKRFGGSVCVLAKVAPEDVIAVPNYDANKMRVCGYHIIFELDDESYRKLKNNRPMTDSPKAQQLLGRAIAGQHIGMIEEVRITQQRGGGVQISPMGGGGKRVKTKGPTPKMAALDDVASTPSVDPKTVAKQVAETKAKPAASAPAATNTGGNRQQKAQALFDNGNIPKLVAFKKAAKVSWASLGFSAEDQEHILKVFAAGPVPKPAPRPATKPAPTVKAPAKRAAPTEKPGRLAQVAEMVDAMKGAKGVARIEAAQKIVDFKRKVKVSWSALGVNPVSERDILFTANMDPAQFSAPAPAKQAARELFDAKDWSGLVAFKKAKKKGWWALGFTSNEEAEIKLHLGG